MEIETESLATKYRPVLAKDVIGQQPFKNVIRTFKSTGKVPKTLLLTGATGLGKTTMARVLARHVNKVKEICEQNDVFEYNIALNATTEEIRNMVARLRYLPRNKEHKSIYILDEVHRLTKQTASALLKEIEEPPSHVMFILCTNEPDLLLPTIRNRCELINLLPYTTDEVMELLHRVCDGEQISVRDEYLQSIAQNCNGGLRDALIALQAVFKQIQANSDLSEQQLDEILSTMFQLDVSNIVQRFLIAAYLSNCDVMVQELLKCQDCSSLLIQLVIQNRLMIKDFYKSGKSEEFKFFATPDVVRKNTGIILDKYGKVGVSDASKCAQQASIIIHNYLMEARKNGLCSALGAQDILLAICQNIAKDVSVVRKENSK